MSDSKGGRGIRDIQIKLLVVGPRTMRDRQMGCIARRYILLQCRRVILSKLCLDIDV
jgi:hypothetical protein